MFRIMPMRIHELETHNFSVEVYCSCGHHRSVQPKFLRKIYGGDYMLDREGRAKLAERWRCMVCGKHQAEIIVGKF